MKMFKFSYLILKKELLHEWATRERALTMGLFGFISAVVFHFTIFVDESLVSHLATGGLWVVFFFSATLGLGRIFIAEKEDSAMDALLVSPISAEAIYLGKTAAIFLLTLFVQLWIWLVFSVLFRLPQGNIFRQFTALFLATLGICAIGTLVAAISVHARKREMLFPILFFPLALPFLMLGASAWAGAECVRYIQMLFACDIIAIASGFILFEYAASE